jgi:hypothetical protein
MFMCNPIPNSENLSWLPILGDFFIYHFFPSLLYYSETDHFRDFYACRRVNKWFRAHLTPPRVRLTPSKFRGFDRMRTIAPIVERLICRGFSDGMHMSRLVESPFFRNVARLKTIEFGEDSKLKAVALSTLFRSLPKLKFLTKLDMKNVQFDDLSVAAMADSCAWNSSITQLILPTYAHMHSYFLTKLSDLVLKCATLTRLEIHVGEMQPREVYDAIGQLSMLDSLLIAASNSDNSSTYEHFGSMLRSLRRLRKLTLKLWDFPKADLTIALDVIGDHPSLVDVTLGYIRLNGKATSFFRKLAKNFSLESLHMDLTVLGEQECAALALCLEGNRNLTSLSMPRSSFGPDAGFAAIVTALEHNSTIKSLNFSVVNFDTIISDSTMAVQVLYPLMKMLARHSSLTHLDITNCNMSQAVVDELGAALVTNRALTSLTIGSFLLRPSLFEGLATNKTLRHLEISRCTLQSEPGRAFAHALTCNVGLVRLSLQGCRITNTAFNQILVAMPSNSTLALLEFDGSDIFSDGPPYYTLPIKDARLKIKPPSDVFKLL